MNSSCTNVRRQTLPLHNLLQNRLSPTCLMLISSSRNLSLRIAATVPPDKTSEKIFKTANVLPPNVQANLQLAASLKLIPDVVLPQLVQKHHGAIVYVCFVKLPDKSDQRYQACRIIDLCSDPYGLMSNNEDETVPIRDLEGIFLSILSAVREFGSMDVPPPVIIDSIVPLLLASKSLASVQRFLSKLGRHEEIGSVILALLTDVIPEWNSLSLKELANVNLLVEGGSLNIIRKAKHGNNLKVVREIQEFSLDDSYGIVLRSGAADVHSISESRSFEQSERKETEPINQLSTKLQDFSLDTGEKQKTVQLRLEEEDERKVVKNELPTKNKPRIFMDDDDIEFDDLDDEDPDDDLDI